MAMPVPQEADVDHEVEQIELWAKSHQESIKCLLPKVLVEILVKRLGICHGKLSKNFLFFLMLHFCWFGFLKLEQIIVQESIQDTVLSSNPKGLAGDQDLRLRGLLPLKILRSNFSCAISSFGVSFIRNFAFTLIGFPLSGRWDWALRIN